MGNEYELDLNKYNCSCIQNEEGCFIDFLNNIKSKEPFNLINTPDKISQSELQETTPGGMYYPNDNMVKSNLKKYNSKKKNSFLSDESEKNNNEVYHNNTNEKNTINLNLINHINNEDQKKNDIKEFDKKTDYFLLANQINNVINELKMNLYSDNGGVQIPSKTPNPDKDKKDNLNSEENLNFEKAIKKAGKFVDKIIFNNIINCVKKISDIHSEVILLKEKLYLGIVNKFKKEKNDKYLINYFDDEIIIDLPNFNDIKEKYRLKLGNKFNNPKFKFNKFSIKGSFPNEILIWNLISQNTQKIAEVLTQNYYCCIVLLYYSKVEEENETIIYLINKHCD